MLVGDRIRKKRIELGLSQEELGDLIGVSKVSVCGYEKGNRTPTIETVILLVPHFLASRIIVSRQHKS